MIIKKYLAKTEREAIELAKAELGNNAIVMNIKKVKPKGLSKLFVRGKVEVTAALDENIVYDQKDDAKSKEESNKYRPDIVAAEDEKEVAVIEEKLNNLQQLLEKQMVEKEEKSEKKEKDEKPEKESHTKERSKSEACKDLILQQMMENEVDEKLARTLMDEIDKSLPKDAKVDQILASVYQKIILMLGRPYTIDIEKNSGVKYIFFLGSTGVGKTTTIAKLASRLKLHDKANIALITADTYRIAAVDQLKTYANILGVPLKVVYTPEELKNAKEELDQYDVCLVDTAGRSQKNKEQLKDIENLLEQIPINERQVYLVLNAGTKYNDLKEITSVYQKITDYSMIFTKLDETNCQGIMFNLKVMTKQPLSYVTWGQNVPDDIGTVDAQKVAKKLLGGKS